MKFGTMTFLTTLILTGVLTIPVRLAAWSVPNSKDGGPDRNKCRPGRRPFQTLNLCLFRHFQ